MIFTGIITGVDCTVLSFVSFFFCEDDSDEISIIIAPITLKTKILEFFVSGERVTIDYEELKCCFHHPNLDGDVNFEAKVITPAKESEG